MLGKNAALLIIDVQQGFADPAWGARNNLDAGKRIVELLEAFRADQAPVLHIRHESQSPMGHFRPGTPGIEPMGVASRGTIGQRSITLSECA